MNKHSIDAKNPMDDLLHIRVGKQLKKEIRKFVNSGLFSNQIEVVNEAVRDLLLKYREMKEEKYEDNK